MTTLRKIIYIATLAMIVFNFMPSPASAQETARGTFRLKRAVYWQNVTIPAGEYSFSIEENSSLLRLSKMTGPPTSYFLMVSSKGESHPTDTKGILVETNALESYVSAMHLPESGLTLRFDVPHMPQKLMAKAEDTLSRSRP